jgi:hypothetical protein
MTPSIRPAIRRDHPVVGIQQPPRGVSVFAHDEAAADCFILFEGDLVQVRYDIAQPADALYTANGPDEVSDLPIAIRLQIERSQRGRKTQSEPRFLASDLGLACRCQCTWQSVCSDLPSLAASPLVPVTAPAFAASKELFPVIYWPGFIHTQLLWNLLMYSQSSLYGNARR